jgi:hypothetical protein
MPLPIRRTSFEDHPRRPPGFPGSSRRGAGTKEGGARGRLPPSADRASAPALPAKIALPRLQALSPGSGRADLDGEDGPVVGKGTQMIARLLHMMTARRSRYR